MDKPELLISIELLHPSVSLDYIKELAREEINRQIKESINGMLHKKPTSVLNNIAEYMPPIIVTTSNTIVTTSKKSKK